MKTNSFENPGTKWSDHPMGLDRRLEISRVAQEVFNRVEEAVANATLLPRSSLMEQLFDPRRNIDDECGYPPGDQPVNIDLLRQLYDREPIATRVVEVLPMESWQVQPRVYEDEDSKTPTAFEQAWDDCVKALTSDGPSWYEDPDGEGLPIWEYLRRADILSGIGHFGVILLGIDDGKNLQEPVDGVMIVNDSLPLTNVKHGDKEYQELVIPEETWNTKQTIYNGFTEIQEDIRDEAGVKRKHTKYVNNVRPEEINYGWSEYERKLGSLTANAKRETTRPKNSAGSTSALGGTSGYRDPGAAPPPGAFISGADSQYAPTSGPGQYVPVGLTPGTNPPGLTQQYSEYIPGYELGAGMGMPPASLDGTDQQYFGVQFGPSERFPNQDQIEGALGSSEARLAEKPKHRLLFIRPFDESLVQIVRYEWNIRNPRFGQPVMYRITLNDPREQHSGVGLPLATVFVHWSRLVHLADQRRTSEIFGVPRMRPVLNRLLDIRKVHGASAEGYYKTAFTAYSFETHPQLGGDVEVNQQNLKDQWEQFINGLQRALFTQGMSVKTLAPQVIDPSPHIDKLVESICIQIACPKRVFMGSERGELASGQDDAKWNDILRARQKHYITPRLIVPFVNRLILLGILPVPESGSYHVEWPDMDSETAKDKAAIALQIVQALAAFIQGNLETMITPLDFLIHFLRMDEDIANSVIKAAAKAHAKEDTMTIPPMDGGRPTAPQKGQEGYKPPPPKVVQVPGQPGNADGGAAGGNPNNPQGQQSPNQTTPATGGQNPQQPGAGQAQAAVAAKTGGK